MARYTTAAAVALAITGLWAQETPVFRSETTLALVSFHVVRQHRYLLNLKREDVVLLEDGVERPITLFEGSESGHRTTLDFLLVFDTSGSVMNIGLLNPLAFQAKLLDGRPELRLAVYGFDTRLRRYCEPTRDAAILRTAIEGLQAKSKLTPAEIPIRLPPKRKNSPTGGTWLYESIIAAALDSPPNAAESTRMLLVFSDGLGTTTSEPEDAANVCREAGIPVYPVLLGHQRLVERIREQREKEANSKYGIGTGSANLENQEREGVNFGRLGELTGGRSFDPPAINLDVMNAILSTMQAEVQARFVAGFVPTAGRHKVEIRLRDKRAGEVVGGTRMVSR